MRRSVHGRLVCALLACAAALASPGHAAGSDGGELVYSRRLGRGWQDLGWAPRELAEGRPARLRLSERGGWILVSSRTFEEPRALSFSLRAPEAFGDFLEVKLDTGGAKVFPWVRASAGKSESFSGGWRRVKLTAAQLNPEGQPFDRLVFRAARDLPPDWVELDDIQLGPAQVRRAPPVALASAATRPSEAPAGKGVRLRCQDAAHRISPLVYGIAYDPRLDHKEGHQWELGATARRWGGNPSSRYNWELGNAWNTAADWFFRNVNYSGSPRFTYRQFLEDNHVRGVKTALTVPTLGWVAKDTRSASFPASTYGPQQQMDPHHPVGNGVAKSGKPLPSPAPTQTSVPAPPEMIGRWVQAIREADAASGRRSVDQYILDNEPMLWHDTHRDVHPTPVTYDELLERTIAYGAAVRKADPEAVIAGPALWGWPAYFYSAADSAAGIRARPDRRAHGDAPLLPWLLRKLVEHRERTGVRVLDVVDVHYYPQAKGVGKGSPGGGLTDPVTNAARIRSTRSLWDPSYRDESWINDQVRLLPRLKEWIREIDPALGISIGEYAFGAEHHMSGALAQAEALGRFGEAGITSAFYWTYPDRHSPVFWAFRAFRNYDGRGAAFQTRHLPAAAPPGTSLFASVNEAGTKLTVVALNLEPARPAHLRLELEGCGALSGRRTFVYAGGAAGFQEREVGAEGPIAELLPAYSISVLELSLSPPKGR